MIIWGGYTDLGVSDNGARYAPATNSWTTMGQGMACPSARGEQSSVWTGSSMIVWGGYTGDAYLGSGGIYSPGTALVPIISGPSEGCLGSSVVLSTDNYSAYQWYKDGSPISGAVAQTCSVSQAGSYTVAATDAYGCTGQSNAKAITFTTGTAPPVAPKNINAVGICGEIVVTWDVSDGATSYNLLRGATCSTPETVFTEVISPYSDTTAIPGMIYQYAVVALNACGSSARSSCVAASSIGVPAVPSGPIFTSVTSTSVSLNWAMVTGATSYDVWRAEGNSCSGAVKITASPISGTKYNDASLKACTQYSYYVVANNECGASANGACASVTTSAQIPAAPAAPTFSAISCTTLTVNWAEVAGATGYDVWRAIGASCAGAVKISASPVSGTSFNDSGLESFAQYSYFVVASNNCGSSANGVCASVTTTALPEVPGDVSAVGTCGGVTLSWAPSLGATSYNVLRGTVCGAAVTMFTNVTRSFIDTTAVPGTNYQYWVVGVNSCGTSQNSTCAAAKRLGVPAAPLSPSFTAVGCAGLTVNWASAAGATSYDVWRAVGATCDGAVKINGAPMTGTSYNDGSLVSGTQYSYFITANNDCGASGNGGCASVTATAVPSPTISGSSANVCPTPYVALAASAGYVAYQWNFNGVPISGATQSTYNVSLSGNYSVTATDANGCIGTSAQKAVTETYCATAEVSPAEAPVPVRLAKDATSPTGYYLYFQKAANATGYNIYEGNIGTWYSHANAAGNLCHAAVTDLGTGEMRAIITPSSDGRYYLVTAYRVTKEGPSGYDSSGNEVPASQSTCSP
jgi:fibronectin type 3 domain-containing protein